MPIALEVGEFEHFFDRAAVIGFRRASTGERKPFGNEPRRDPRVPGDEEILDHGEVREELAVLERSRNAEPRDLGASARG
jgi:hypothetical protein